MGKGGGGELADSSALASSSFLQWLSPPHTHLYWKLGHQRCLRSAPPPKHSLVDEEGGNSPLTPVVLHPLRAIFTVKPCEVICIKTSQRKVTEKVAKKKNWIEIFS